MTATQETTNNVREDKERERRRKRYKFALVRWEEMNGWEDAPTICIERKDVLRTWWAQSHTVLCDDQPERVLRGMMKLMEENEDG
jgi:hypothetical protein